MIGLIAKSAIAVEAIVTIVEAAASVTPMVPRNPEHTVHGTDCATHTSADGTTHDRADWSGRASSLTGAFLRAADNALCMSEMRNRQQGESKRSGCQMKLRREMGWLRQRPGLGIGLRRLHLISL
jgi:hypothetical protein